MKKTFLLFLVIGVIVAAFGTAGIVAASNGNPPGNGIGPGSWHAMKGQDGFMGRGGILGKAGRDGGALHDYLVTEFAKVVGITPEEFQAKLDSGMSILQILREKGLTDEEIKTAINTAYKAALDAAVAANVLTQEQADWLQQKHEKVFANGSLPQNYKPDVDDPGDESMAPGSPHGHAYGHQKQEQRGRNRNR